MALVQMVTGVSAGIAITLDSRLPTDVITEGPLHDTGSAKK